MQNDALSYFTKTANKWAMKCPKLRHWGTSKRLLILNVFVVLHEIIKLQTEKLAANIAATNDK